MPEDTKFWTHQSTKWRAQKALRNTVKVQIQECHPKKASITELSCHMQGLIQLTVLNQKQKRE